MAGISRVVLYKHGVGYFEREEAVSGDQELRLTFRSTEMNDVLKSLTLHDQDGGTVHSVSYDTQKPVARLLEEVALDIPAEGGSAALLGRVRGARVKVSAGSREVSGQVVGIEKTQRRSADGIETRALLSLLDAKGNLHTVDLTEVAQLSFLDEHIRRDLGFYFDTLIHTYKRDAKNLCIHARGKGKRTLHLSYVIECPVWKTSYRILLPEKRKEAPFLQGWALIDNTQDEDWEDVQLSLVAGLPISFIHDLYSPRYIQRQEVEVEREAAAGPVMAEAAFGALAEESMDLFAGGAPAMAPPPAPGSGVSMMRQRSAALKESARQMTAQTVTQSLGDLFEYSISHPVTVRRNQSALVPIVASDFEGRRVVLYNRDRRPQNPFAAIDFKNTTGLTLEAGPVVVSEKGTYAGEAMLDTLKPGENRLLSFAVDLGVGVESDHDYRLEDIHYVRVQHGRLEMQRARIETRTYQFDNKDKRRKTCLLEHPLRPDFELWETPEPKEKTHSFYRFEVSLGPIQTTTFQVTERCIESQWVDLRTITEEQLGLYVSRGYIRPAQEKVLSEVASLLHSQSKLRSKLRETEQKVKAIAHDQNRLRDNLKSLGATTDEARLRSRYVAKFENQENEMEKLAELTKRLQAEIDRREDEVDKALSKLTFEVVVGEAQEAESAETVEMTPEEHPEEPEAAPEEAPAEPESEPEPEREPEPEAAPETMGPESAPAPEETPEPTADTPAEEEKPD